MRIGYLIGALKTGGSERQLSELAVGMAARGHVVQVACYDGPGIFDAYVEERGAKVVRMDGGSKLNKVRAIRRWIAEFRPDILHGFMKRASSLAILANLPRRRCKVVTSDYSTASYARHKWDLWASLVLWSLADTVATQTEMNRRSLALLAPWLRGRLSIVRNGVETRRFVPGAGGESHAVFRFLVVGTVYSVKNPIRVVEAVRILKRKVSRPFRVRWVGPTAHAGRHTEEYLSATRLVEQYDLSDVIEFSGPSNQMEEIYRDADCLVHVSLQEGMPNAVVEAMACGLPIVVSQVSDLPLIVQEAQNGFVCNQTDPASIASAMESAIRLGDDERKVMGRRSRELAVQWFDRVRFDDDYERIYETLLGCRE